MLILGIETSCDECSVGLVEDGHRLLSNVVSSQVDMHARYGGVVPEVASRQHLLECIRETDKSGIRPVPTLLWHGPSSLL